MRLTSTAAKVDRSESIEIQRPNVTHIISALIFSSAPTSMGDSSGEMRFLIIVAVRTFLDASF